MWIYESHMGGLYTSDEPIDYEDRYCEQCGDSDWEIGCFDTSIDFLEYYADEINYEGSGGYDLEDLYYDVICMFDEIISMEEAIEIVKKNRTVNNDEDGE